MNHALLTTFHVAIHVWINAEHTHQQNNNNYKNGVHTTITQLKNLAEFVPNLTEFNRIIKIRFVIG